MQTYDCDGTSGIICTCLSLQVTVISSPMLHLSRPFTVTGLRIYPQSWPAHQTGVRRPVLPYPVFIACNVPPVSAARDVIGKGAPEMIPVSRYDAWSAVLAAVFTDTNGHLWQWCSCTVLKRQKISTRILLHTTALCLSRFALKFGLHRSTLSSHNFAQTHLLLVWASETFDG